MKPSLAWVVIALGLMISHAGADTRTVRVFVALADNASQGIAKVPAKIGNGDDAELNLYWGNSEGFKSVFGRSKSWKLEKAEANPVPEILDRRTYKHACQDCRIIAEAWRGKNIRECLEAFLAALHSPENTVSSPSSGTMASWMGPFPFRGSEQRHSRRMPSSSAVFSGRYFQSHLDAAKSRPVLSTAQLMYPGSFLLRDALEVWLRQGSRSDIRMAAARAYASNQKISVKAASGVFTKLE
ncbi:MAG: hypothetical protein V4662_25860 [Verrucomicrobiota bacterium]